MSSLGFSETKRHKLFERIAVFATLMGFFHAVEDASNGLEAAPIIDVVISISVFGGYLLYRRGYFEITRIVGLTFINVIFAIYASLLPKEVGIYLFYFPLIAVSFALFDSTERRLRIAFVVISITLLLALFITDFKLLGDHHIEAGNVSSWFIVNLLSSTFILIMSVNFVLQVNEEAEKHLQDLAEEIKIQNRHLEKTNAELDRFLYSTSHDLRAPLSSIKGLVNIAAHETTDPVLQKYFTMMIERADKLDFFIKDIIDYSRNSRTEVSIDHVDFHQLIDEAKDNFLYMEGALKIRFEKNIGCHMVYSDKGRLSVLLNNLISNAIKYHNLKQVDPWIRVDVSCKNNTICILVADNGQGISRENISRVFEMFYRGHEYSKGSGLGLYIVKEIIDKLDGTIDVESTEGVGTTFSIVIPAASARKIESVPLQPEPAQQELVNN